MSSFAIDLRYEYYAAATGQKGGTLVKAGVAQQPLNVQGCGKLYVVVSTLNGSDVWQLQGRILSGRWVDFGGPLNSNTEYQTSDAMFDEVQAVRVSGSGNTTLIQMRARL